MIRLTELKSYQRVLELRRQLDDAQAEAADAAARADEARTLAAQRAASGEEIDMADVARVDQERTSAEMYVATLEQALQVAQQRCQDDQAERTRAATSQREDKLRAAHHDLRDALILLTDALGRVRKARDKLADVAPGHVWIRELPWQRLARAADQLQHWPAELPEPCVKESRTEERVLIRFNAPHGPYSTGEVAGFPPGKADKLLAQTAEVFDAAGNRKRLPLCEKLERKLGGELVPASSG